MSTQSPNPTKLQQVAKHATAYVLMAVVGLMGFFARGFFGQSTGRTSDCQAELKAAQEELRQSRSDYKDLTRELLVKQGVIDAVPAILDSVIKTKTVTPKK